MYYELYIDRIFLINFVMNLFMLILTAKTLNRTATRFRIGAGSAVGAAGYCIILCLPLSYPVKILIGLVPVGMGMSRFTFRSQGFRPLVRETGCMFVYAFLIGGFMLFLLNRVSWLRANSGKIWCVLGTASAAFIILYCLVRLYRNHKSNPFCKVVIPCDGMEVRVTALLDTGNGLYEPVSGKPVSILEKQVWVKLKPLMRDEKLKIIPYTSVGNSRGLMRGYEVPLMVMEREGQKRYFEKVVIGICEEQISSGKQYQMILHPDLVENKKKEVFKEEYHGF